MRGLRENEQYEFRIAAVNKAGMGPYAECAESLIAKDPIGEQWFKLGIIFLYIVATVLKDGREQRI